MPERVVDVLEPVEVHEHYRRALVAAAAECGTDRVDEVRAVGESGQRVVRSLVFTLAHLARHTLDEAAVLERHAGMVRERLEQPGIARVERAALAQTVADE